MMARGQGFEPRFSGPEPDVLPLDDPRLLSSYVNLYYINNENRSIFAVWIHFREYLLDWGFFS